MVCVGRASRRASVLLSLYLALAVGTDTELCPSEFPEEDIESYFLLQGHLVIRDKPHQQTLSVAPDLSDLDRKSETLEVDRASQQSDVKVPSNEVVSDLPAHPKKLLREDEIPWLWQTETINIFVIVKICCIISSLLLQVSPSVQIKHILQEKDVDELDAAPFVSLAYGCCQSTFYGLYGWWESGNSGFSVIVESNILGAFLGVFYVMVYHANCYPGTQAYLALRTYYKYVFALVLVQASSLRVLEPRLVVMLAGVISSLASLATGFSPLKVAHKVLESRCSASIPVSFVLAVTVYSTVWSACGLLLGDLWILVPNLMCAIACVFMLSLVVRFPRTMYCKPLVQNQAAPIQC